jgi:hypothetical protein
MDHQPGWAARDQTTCATNRMASAPRFRAPSATHAADQAGIGEPLALFNRACRWHVFPHDLEGLYLARRALPLFYGLILGELVIGGGWTLAGFLWGFQPWAFWQA